MGGIALMSWNGPVYPKKQPTVTIISKVKENAKKLPPYVFT